MNRNLDGCYFRIKRNDTWENICFSDLTDAERDIVTANQSAEWLRSLCYHLADRLSDIGEQLDLSCE